MLVNAPDLYVQFACYGPVTILLIAELQNCDIALKCRDNLHFFGHADLEYLFFNRKQAKTGIYV